MAPPGFIAPGPLSPHVSAGTAVTRRATWTRRRTRGRPSPRATMHFLEAAHTAPEFMGHVMASCGAALFGVLGLRATKGSRAVFSAKHAAERRAIAEMRHVRRLRRSELAEGARLGYSREWEELDVDGTENRRVPLTIPEYHGDTRGFIAPAERGRFASFDQMLEQVDRDKFAEGNSERRIVERRQGRRTPVLHNPPAGSEFLDADSVLE